jgi:hypothetical protein
MREISVWQYTEITFFLSLQFMILMSSAIVMGSDTAFFVGGS